MACSLMFLFAFYKFISGSYFVENLTWQNKGLYLLFDPNCSLMSSLVHLVRNGAVIGFALDIALLGLIV